MCLPNCQLSYRLPNHSVDIILELVTFWWLCHASGGHLITFSDFWVYHFSIVSDLKYEHAIELSVPFPYLQMYFVTVSFSSSFPLLHVPASTNHSFCVWRRLANNYLVLYFSMYNPDIFFPWRLQEKVGNWILNFSEPHTTSHLVVASSVYSSATWSWSVVTCITRFHQLSVAIFTPFCNDLLSSKILQSSNPHWVAVFLECSWGMLSRRQN